jgi:hypothetical protein
MLEGPEVRSVRELIEFNNKNATRTMPKREFNFPPSQNRLFTDIFTGAHTDQTDLIQTLESTLTDEIAAAAKAHGR